MGTLADAVRWTEAEVFGDACGVDPDEGDPAFLNMPDAEGADPWLEQTEGQDGEPLSDEEQFAIANGDVPEGYLGDRPLQFMRERELVAEIERLQALNNTNLAALNELAYKPQAEAERARLHDQLLDAVIDNSPGGGADQLLANIRGQAQHIDQMWRNRIEASFSAAERDYGDDFRERADWLMNDQAIRAKRGDRVAEATVREIVNAPDPGTALMEWESRNPYQPPPFMAGTRRPLSSHETLPARGLTYEDMERFNNSGSDEDIFNSVVGNSGDHEYWRDY